MRISSFRFSRNRLIHELWEPISMAMITCENFW